MERLTNRDKEIPLPNADNALFWARVHEKLARYEDAEEHTYFASKPQTNADRIRAMSDEELAEWIAELTDCTVYPHTRKDAPCVSIGQTCAASWLEWLKQEAT